ncbi:MAG: TolC family protein [Hyphomonadaceae bacterium]|nr:TolC family protein [Hyphomonadaceae bacterium]
MKHGARTWIGIGLLAAAGACAGSRDLPAEPESYVAAAAISPERAAELAASPATTWLDDLNSTEMSALTREALAGSPELQAVEARYRASRWRARGAFGGNLLPSLSIGADGRRTETPTGTEERIRTEIMTSNVSASWEIDLWGRLTARALAADLSADAVRDDLDDARLSVAGQTARAWVDLIEAQQLLALAQEDLSTRERAMELTQRRYDVGVISSLNLRTARSQVASARGNEAQARDALLITSRRLQEIMGRYPDGALRADGQLPALPVLAAAGAPSDLLDRRPDVLAAENRLRAAGLRVHEARAAMLPRLTLTGNAGNSGQGLTDIDDSVNMVSNLIAGATMPIFNGGALFSESRASVADRRAAAADYVRTTIAAWREVEGAISTDQSLEVREREFAIAAAEAREAQDLAEREYARGVATLFELIDAYTRRIDAERGLISARSERVSNRIAYHVALGGGARTGGVDEDREVGQ